MKIAIGSDHRGFGHKEHIVEALLDAGHEIIDCGCDSEDSADYPDPAFAVGYAVAAEEVERGVLICGSGIGVSIAANKVPGVRAALCWTEAMAGTTRRHNDSNVICFSAVNTTPEEAEAMTRIWLATDFEGGRHARRVQKIIDFEQELDSCDVPETNE
jgi:ribose 5-phosphate isomerase B